MKLTNQENHSLSIGIWLATDWYDHNRWPGRDHLSATGLLKPVRMILLSQRAAEKQKSNGTRDISQDIPSRIGTAIHAGIEKAWLKGDVKANLIRLGYPARVARQVKVNPTPQDLNADPDIIPVYVEQRFHKEFEGFIIDGEFDFCGQGVLEDFKSTGVWSFMNSSNDEKYVLQGSIYRWLAPGIITADYMRIQHIFTDWSKMDAMIRKKKGYPRSRIVPKTYPLLSLNETQSYIRNKINQVKAHRDTHESALPQCPPEELWQSPPRYKYFSNPANTRCQKSFNSYAEAHTHMMNTGKGTIRETPGQVRRCGYCDGFDLCTQKDVYIRNNTLVLP